MRQLKKFINLQFIVDVKNYRQSFDKWMKIRLKHEGISFQNREILFNKYLEVIRSKYKDYNKVISKCSPTFYGFYAPNLNDDQISIVKKTLKPLQQYEIVHNTPELPLQNNEVQKLIQKNYTQIFRLDLTKKPSNSQINQWGSGIDVPPISIKGIVVAGKGEGRKNLGMPTANIQLTEQAQKKLKDYPNGVYLVKFDFLNGKCFKGAACLGTNPHYQNFQESRRIEVYVLHDFGEEVFYGSKVSVQILRLIRFQGKFLTFDSFLQAMHNDIQIVNTYNGIQL